MTVVALGLLEGGVILGFSTFFAPTLEASGHGAATAGLVVSLFGAAVLAWSRVVRRLVGHLPPAYLVLIGGGALIAGYGVVAVAPTVGGVAIASLGVAAGWSFIHSTLQSWATQVLPDVRAAAVSCFSAAVFVGSAIVTALSAGSAAHDSFTPLFVTAAGSSLVLAVIGSTARQMWNRHGASTRGAGGADRPAALGSR